MLTKRPIFVLAGNGSYLNRGCEAIVRGTVKILRKSFDKPLFVHAPFDYSRSVFLPKESDSDIVHKPIQALKRWGPKWIAKHIFRFTMPRLEQHILYSSIKNDIMASAAVLSIGGDNYTLDYGVPHPFLALDLYSRNLGRPLIIWGASIGPFDSLPRFSGRMHEHLKSDVTAIFVREESSRNYLAEHGVSKNVILMGDPAFVMEAESVSEDRMGFSLPRDALGVNVSPLMAGFVTAGNTEAWRLKISKILFGLRQKLGRPIVLIPHVTAPGSDDHKFMREVLQHIGSDRRNIFLLSNDFTSAQTKWVISQMKCMIAARTHAAIAALSSCVPTVSLAYSAKAEGINKQLFGHTEFLIKSNNINENSVVRAVKETLQRKDEIGEQLRKTVPEVQQSALNAGQILVDLLKACPRGASDIKERGKKYEKE
ncbi:MAG TPA: polysaccharide pyruvyl transferase family protein [Sedimentisphaerales bacterium]|nr:polysaccharide pyruvyl transferase family protein [Sedimentisphaerales bacterium]